MCVCVSFAVAAVNGEAATLFGNKECFPCLSPRASALAATIVYELSAIVAFTLNGCWRPRGYNRALHLVPLFINPQLLVLMVYVRPGHSSRITTPPRSTQSDSGLLAGVMPIIHCGAQRPLLLYCPMSHFILCTHSVPFFLCLYNLRHTTRCSFFCQSLKIPLPLCH